MRPRPRHAGLRRLFVLTSAFILFPLALGPTPTSAQTSPERPAAEPVALTEQPYEIRSLGMKVRLPVGASLDSTSVSGLETSFTLTAKDSTWLIRMHTPQSRDTDLTAASVAEGLFEELRKTSTGRDPATGRIVPQATVSLIERADNIEINGVTAARFYARVPRVDGVVFNTGYTIFPLAPGRFVIFQLDCLEPEFARARNVYETMVATVALVDRADIAGERAAALSLGAKLLEQFDSEELVALIPAGPRFYRLYRPARTGLPGDDTEVAYQVIEMKRGQRGDLDPRRPQSRWRAADREPGVVVYVKSRFLEGDRVVDSDSAYFLSLDRSAEAWSIRMAVKRGRDTALYTETGARTVDAVEVNIVQPGQPTVSKKWKTPDGYLSQVETHLLPFVLARVGAELEYAFYTYQSQHNDIMFRRDTLEKSERPGEWTVRTQPNEDAAVDTTTLDADGYIVRKILASGLVMEAIRPDELMRIWRNKGLPTD